MATIESNMWMNRDSFTLGGGPLLSWLRLPENAIGKLAKFVS
jgi:hypothetical protein